MKAIVLLAIILICCASQAMNAADEFIISDFTDPAADGPKWGMGDSGDVIKTIEPRTPTEMNNMLKVVFKSGRWPGITTIPPKDWSTYEAVRFTVWTKSNVSINVRIDDPDSTGYATRFNHSFKCEPGVNLCQIEVANIDRVLDVKRIKNFILFTSSPPPGLTVFLDDIILGKLQSEKVEFIPYGERMDLQPSLEVKTPHLPFGKGLAGGPLAIFTMSNVGYGREIPELMQRLDLKVSHMTWDRTYGQNTWGFGDFYGKRGHAFDFVLMQKYISATLQGPESFNVLAMCTPQGWAKFPQGAREALLKRVKEDGEGLVLVFPFPGKEQGQTWPDDLKEISALIDSDTEYQDPTSGYFRAGRGWNNRENWRVIGEHPITADLPLAALPMPNINVHTYKAHPDAQVLIETEKGIPVLAVKQVGKGRVATFSWRTNGSLTPGIADGPGLAEARPYRYWEPLYSLIGRSICWAGGRDLSRTGEAEELKIVANSATGVKPDRAFKVLTWKNAAGEKTDWKLEFTPPAASPIKPVQITVPPQLNRGEELKVNLSLPQGMDVTSADSPYSINVALTEDCNGIIRTIEKTDAAGLKFLGADKNPAYELSFPTARVRQLLAVVKVEVHEGGTLKADGAAEVIVSPVYKAGESRWQDYEILMWPVGGLPFLQPLEDTMMKQFGSTGVMETRWQGLDKRMRWARAGLRLMVHDFARRQLQLSHGRFANLMADWNKTKNRDLLIRKPSYADSAFLEAERKRVTDLIKMLKPFDPTNYITCDEPSLSSYSKDFDFDFHPENITRFRKYLEAKFETVASFNAACNEKATSWDAIEPQITPDTRKEDRWGLWNEWRMHNDNVMADGYKLYKELVESVDPNGTISISGTQLATPFDAFDWYKLSSHFGTMQGYGYAYQDNKRISFNPDMLNAVPAGYGRSGRAVDYQVWSKLCDHGGGHVLFWWIAFRNYDLTYCQSARDYQRLFAEMRGGVGKQFMQGRRKLSPVGILYSMNSMRAAYKDSGESRNYSGPEGQVTGALIDAGFDPQFIADQQVAVGDLNRKDFKVLVMPRPLSLGYGDKPGGLDVKKGIENFIAVGGKVIITEAPKYDEFLQPRVPEAEFMAKLMEWDAVKDNLVNVLAEAGAVPWVKISKPDGTALKGTSVFTHKLLGGADAHIVTVLRKPVGTKEVVGGDGVVHSVPDTEGGNEVEPMHVDVSGFGKVICYDMRAGKELKPDESGKLSIDMRAGDGYPIGLLPYAVSGIKAETTMRDLAIHLNIQLEAQTAAFAPHVIHIEVASGAGTSRTFDPALARNLVVGKDGKVSAVLPLAIEQAGSDFTIGIIDKVSGSQALRELKGQ